MMAVSSATGSRPPGPSAGCRWGRNSVCSAEERWRNREDSAGDEKIKEKTGEEG